MTTSRTMTTWMTTWMTSMTSVPHPDNPLLRLPLVRAPLTWLDGAVLGTAPRWLAELTELVALGVGLYLLLRFTVRILLPALGPWLAVPVGWLVMMLRLVLLAPEWTVTRLLDRLRRLPGPALYAYGDGVLNATDGLATRLEQSLPRLRGLRTVPRWALVLVLVAGFAIWNTATCASDTGTPCVSPIVQWGNDATGWFDAQQHQSGPAGPH
jgi:hypothetical protein